MLPLGSLGRRHLVIFRIFEFAALRIRHRMKRRSAHVAVESRDCGLHLTHPRSTHSLPKAASFTTLGSCMADPPLSCVIAEKVLAPVYFNRGLFFIRISPGANDLVTWAWPIHARARTASFEESESPWCVRLLCDSREYGHCARHPNLVALKEVDIRDRIKEIVDTVVPRHRRFKALEELSGLQAQTWRSIYEGRQRATEEAILALCKNWPKYAYWLGTGMTDEDHGHSSPILERVKRDSEMLRKSGKLRLK